MTDPLAVELPPPRDGKLLNCLKIHAGDLTTDPEAERKLQ